jgi:hypothetical protein
VEVVLDETRRRASISTLTALQQCNLDGAAPRASLIQIYRNSVAANQLGGLRLHVYHARASLPDSPPAARFKLRTSFDIGLGAHTAPGRKAPVSPSILALYPLRPLRLFMQLPQHRKVKGCLLGSEIPFADHTSRILQRPKILPRISASILRQVIQHHQI